MVFFTWGGAQEGVLHVVFPRKVRAAAARGPPPARKATMETLEAENARLRAEIDALIQECKRNELMAAERLKQLECTAAARDDAMNQASEAARLAYELGVANDRLAAADARFKRVHALLSAAQAEVWR